MRQIGTLTIELMKTAEVLFNEGHDKKRYVLDILKIKYKLSDEKLELIDDIIDIIILIDKNKLKIGKTAKGCFQFATFLF